jgi:hypothetical protein
MAGNSNNKQNKNNNRNPTLRDHERERGRSGHAIHAKGVLATGGSERSAMGASGAPPKLGHGQSRDSGHN